MQGWAFTGEEKEGDCDQLNAEDEEPLRFDLCNADPVNVLRSEDVEQPSPARGGSLEERTGHAGRLGRPGKIVSGLRQSIVDKAQAPFTLTNYPIFKSGDDSGQTRTQASLNLLNNLLGAGLLAMPKAFAKSGLITGLLLMVALAVANRYTLLLVFSMSESTLEEASYPQIARHVFGEHGIISVWCSYIIFSGGCLVIYFIALTDIFSQMPLLSDSPRFVLVLIAMAVCSPGAIVKSLKHVSFFSGLCMMGVCTLVVTLSFVCLIDLTSVAALEVDPSDAGVVEYFRYDLYDMAMAASVFALQFSVQAGGIEVLSNISREDRQLEDDDVGMDGGLRGASDMPMAEEVSFFSYTVALLFSGVMGCAGYIRFGDKVKGDFLLNFRIEGFESTLILARIAYGVVVTCSFAFVMVPCRYATVDLFGLRNEASGTDEIPRAAFRQSTIGIFLVCGFVAWLVPDLSQMIEFISVWSTMSLAFIFPSTFLIEMRRRSEGIAVFCPENVMPLVMILIGCAVTGISTLHYFQTVDEH